MTQVKIGMYAESEVDNVNLEIVRKYRRVYRTAYMMQTLEVTEPRSEPMRLQAFLKDGSGFPGHFITVLFDEFSHPDIWVSNLLIKQPDGKLAGVILVSTDLLRLPRERRKEILAEEWIEVMVGFENQGRPEKRVAGRAAMIARLYNLSLSVKPSVPWEDTSDEKSTIQVALREILVSQQSLDEMAPEFGFMSLRAIKNIFTKDPARAQTTIEELAARFSEKKSVQVDLVIDRIREILLKDYS